MLLRKVLFIFVVVFCLSLLLIHAHSSGPVDDGLFYIKQAVLLKDDGFLRNLPWLYFTPYRMSSPGLHFLFPILLIPFVGLFSLPTAAFVSAAFLFSMACILLYWLLSKLPVIFPEFWLVLIIFGSGDFLFRMLLTRPIAASLSVLLLELYLIKAEKNKYLIILGFFYAWLYDGYILFLLLPIAILFSQLILDKRINIKPIIWALDGVATGLIINPFFPQNVLFHHFILTPTLFSGSIQNSREWQPYPLYELIKVNWLVLSVFVIGIITFVKNIKKLKQDRNYSFKFALLIISFTLFATMLKSRRFVEYWVPFTIIFAAFQFNNFRENFLWKNLSGVWKKFWQFRVAAIVFIIVIGYGIYSTVTLSYGYFNSMPKGDLYQGASTWLSQNSRPKEIVFDTQWDQFDQLFYYDHSNYYVVGLDPTFLYKYDSRLYWQWRRISDDQSDQWTDPQEIHDIIKNQFQSRYVFLEHSRNPNLEAFLDQNPTLFTQTYSDAAVAIYQVN